MLGRDVTRSFTESSAESTTGDRFNSVRRISRLIGGNFTGIYNVSCWWASADTRPTRFVAFQSIRGGGEWMQINGGGKHHALTKFYLDKSVDTRHRDEAVIYIYIHRDGIRQPINQNHSKCFMDARPTVDRKARSIWLFMLYNIRLSSEFHSFHRGTWLNIVCEQEILEICDIT